MNIIPADFLEKSRHVFVDNPGISLLDVRKKVEAEPEGVARRDRLSALDAVLKLFKRPLHHVQASNAGLNSVFRGHHGPELGISRKRFQNIKSAVFQAVRRCDSGNNPAQCLSVAIKLHHGLLPLENDALALHR